MDIPDLKKVILDAQPYAFIPPPPQKSRRLNEIIDRRLGAPAPKPKPKPKPKPGPQTSACTTPSNPDPFSSEDCAIQYIKDTLYGDDKNLGVFTNSVTMMDNHLKALKEKYLKMKPAQCMQDTLVEYTPVLPHIANQKAPPPMKYYFNCYDDTDQELWPNSNDDKKGKIYLGADNDNSIFYVAEFFALKGKKNMVLVAVDNAQEAYDYWHIVATPNGKIWTMHSGGSFSDYTIQTTVAGTAKDEDLPAGCGIVLLSTTADIFGEGIFDTSGRNGKTCSDYVDTNTPAPDHQSWGTGSTMGLNKFCSPSDVLDANTDYTTEGNSWECYMLSMMASQMSSPSSPFQFLTADDISQLNEPGKILDDWSTKLTGIKKISVVAKKQCKKKNNRPCK